MKNNLLFLLKILFISVAIVLVIAKANLNEIINNIKHAYSAPLVLAFIFLLMSHLISAFRGRFYFAKNGLVFNNKFAVALYFTGLFYNTILPGSIGGDGYKIYKMKKLAGFSRLKVLRLLISDRANGFYILTFYALTLSYFTNFITIYPPSPFIGLGIAIILLTPCYLISIKLLLKETASTAFKAAKYSVIVQLTSVLSAICIFIAIGVGKYDSLNDYVVLFLLSSIVSVIPISIGGAGLREITFLYGSHIFLTNAEKGIAFSLVFFAVNFICALFGLVFLNKLDVLYKNST